MTVPVHDEAEAAQRRDYYRARRTKRSRAMLVIGCALLVTLLSVVIWHARRPAVDAGELMKDANVAFARHDYPAARDLALQVLKRKPDHPAALLLAGKCLKKQGDAEAAVELLSKAPMGSGSQTVDSALLAGDLLLFDLARPSAAEQQYQKAIREAPASLEANNRLAVLYAITGQWWRHIPVRLAAMRAGRIDRSDLFVLALAENALVEPELSAKLHAMSPGDPLLQLAAARLALEDEHRDEAIKLLRQAVEQSPTLAQAQVRLGAALYEGGRFREFADWNARLPDVAAEHPGVWVLRGNWGLRQKHPRVALRCFCEAVRRDPNHPHALYQAGRILTSLKRTREATLFLTRATKVQEFLNATKAADVESALEEAKRAAILAESLGNTWEAYGWATLAASHPSRPDWARAMSERLKPALPTLPLQRTVPDHNPVAKFDYRAFPLSPAAGRQSPPPASTADTKSLARFSFQDRAKSLGIAFQYFNGSESVQHGTRHMYEVMGGGVAVLDFNGDHRPDLYFTQGTRWPVDESKAERLDRLYLNTGSGFVDVTETCGIRENRFSQGVAAGDVDSDGLPDLLVANIGKNRLYHNNGDGTFSDVSRDAGLVRSDWSTSCAIADLNGDGNSELYFVNYLKGADVFTRTCGPRHDGVCLPQQFAAATDRLHFSDGRGGFRDVTKRSGIDVANGKGLGIVIASFANSRGPNVFIANDTVANFYFENLGPGPDGAPRFRERALLAGLALNRFGRAQASMGVAAGDADGDGRLDLFVTNFHGESNALYRMLADGSFVDEAMHRRLRRPSLSKLGFGTQFLDADLDGRPDLIVANGHIDDFSRDGRTEYQMNPQFFANTGASGFRSVDARSLGAYFSRKLLGRSLARLDWNGDGREDVVVSHLDAPAALLENTIKTPGRFVALRLCGVASHRDAIGTVVRLHTNRNDIVRELTAGDGFQACNERLLVFGLGNETAIRSMTVTWPSGRRSEFAGVAANTRWILVEGSGHLLAEPVE